MKKTLRVPTTRDQMQITLHRFHELKLGFPHATPKLGEQYLGTLISPYGVLRYNVGCQFGFIHALIGIVLRTEKQMRGLEAEGHK